MTTPLITTIIPTYRRPDTLKLAIRSVLAQQGPLLRVCVYDNASGDDTEAVVREIAAGDARVQYYRHARNIGALANFQFGLGRVETPFFSLLSDDDMLLPGFFERALNDLEAFGMAMFWAGLTVRMTSNGTVYDARVELWPREGLYSPPEGLFELAHGKAPTWTGVVFRREVLDRVGLLDLEVRAPSDLDFILRIAAHYPFLLRKQPVAVFVLNPESFSEQSPLADHWPGWLKMIGNVAAVDSLSGQARERISDMLNADARRMLLRRSANALQKGNYAFARQAARVLHDHYRKPIYGLLIRALAAACANIPPLQRIYSLMYRSVERRILQRRSELQRRYAAIARFRAQLLDTTAPMQEPPSGSGRS
jgi:glycosyltransferase involved in cell wall biosynthesis